MDIPNPTSVSTPPVTPNSFSPAPDHKTKRPWLVIGILIVVALIAVAWFLGPLKSITQNLHGTLALQGAYVVTVDDKGIPLVSKVGWFGLKEVKISEFGGTVTEYVTSSSANAAIIQAMGGGQDVYLLGDNPIRLTTNGGDKRWLAISPDGNYLAYSQQEGMSSDIADWSVHIIDTASGSEFITSDAFGPQFFAREGESYVGYMTSSGISVQNLSTRDVTRGVVLANSDTNYPTLISPDGLYIAVYNLLSKTYQVATVEMKTPGSLAAYSASATPIAGKVLGLTDDAIIVSTTDNEHARIEYRDYENHTTADWKHVFPENSSILKVLPK